MTITIMTTGVLIGFALSIPILFVCFACAGGGHGFYAPMFLCFPYAMLLAAPLQRIPMLLVFLQFPAYGAVVAWSRLASRTRAVCLGLGCLHVTAVVLALVFAAGDGSFWP